MIEQTTLPNGIRVITDQIQSVESVALGCYFGVGTRHEDLKANGVAHMVEHMMFKGTKTRTGKQIAEIIENVGGQMNAYTGREITGYHMHLLKEHTFLALEILADMLQNSVFIQEELEKEREVILQEIGMVSDTPDDLVFDYYHATAYPDQGLGAAILGRADIVAVMERQNLIDYTQRLYTPDTLVISAAGNISHQEFVAQVVKLFSVVPARQQPRLDHARYQGGESRTAKDLEQAHVVLGFQGVCRTDENYYSAVALAHLLGGGFSSRLFQEIRENRGLAYVIYAFHSAFADDGQFAIYAGTGSERLHELLPVVTDELKNFSSTLNEQEIKRVKTQLKANLLMGRESMTTRADQQAKYLLFHRDLFNPETLINRIEKISVDSVRVMADKFFSSTPTLAALGPIGKLQSYDDIKARLAA